jgi:hypothetical protein
MGKVKQWKPGQPLLILDPGGYPGVKDVHCHNVEDGNILIKMVFSNDKPVYHRIDGETLVSDLENVLDQMYDEGEQNGWVQSEGLLAIGLFGSDDTESEESSAGETENPGDIFGQILSFFSGESENTSEGTNQSANNEGSWGVLDFLFGNTESDETSESSDTRYGDSETGNDGNDEGGGDNDSGEDSDYGGGGGDNDSGGGSDYGGDGIDGDGEDAGSDD